MIEKEQFCIFLEQQINFELYNQGIIPQELYFAVKETLQQQQEERRKWE